MDEERLNRLYRDILTPGKKEFTKFNSIVDNEKTKIEKRRTKWFVTGKPYDVENCYYVYGQRSKVKKQKIGIPNKYPQWLTKLTQDVMDTINSVMKSNNSNNQTSFIYRKHWNPPNRLPDSCMINYYPNKNSDIKQHSDDESIFYKRKPFSKVAEPICIVSLSLNQSRDFILSLKTDKEERERVRLEHGDILLMYGEMQDHWYHQVERRYGYMSRDTFPGRINFTWRWFPKDPKMTLIRAIKEVAVIS